MGPLGLTLADLTKALIGGVFVLTAAFIGGWFAIRVGRDKVRADLDAERTKSARNNHVNQARAVAKVVSRVDRCVGQFVILGKAAPTLTQDEYLEQLLNPVTSLAEMIGAFREEKGNLPESIIGAVRDVRRGLLGILTSTSMVTSHLSKEKADQYRLKALNYAVAKFEILKAEANAIKSAGRPMP